VYGGNPNCEHEWSEETKEWHEGTGAGEKQLTNRGSFHNDAFSKHGFCVKCGAWRGQLGLEPHPQMYVDHLVLIFREVKRVLKRTGSVYLVLGDTFAGSLQGYGAKGKTTGFQECAGVEGSRFGIDKPPQSSKFNESWIRPKQQLNIPFHVAFALQQDGWIQRARAIWHKPNSMPGSQKDRLTCSYEFIFHFVKNDETVLWRNMETGEWRSTRPVQMYVKNVGNLRVATTERPAVLKKTIDECSDLEVEERKKWRRLWMGFDYYYELDAIREPHTSIKDLGRKRLDTRTPKHDLAVELGAGSVGPSGYLVQHPLGKNPGDAFIGKYAKDPEAVGSPRARTSREGYDAESHFYSEKGKNPGDVFRDKTVDEAFKGPLAVRNAPEPCEPQAFHPLGKNPGDVYTSEGRNQGTNVGEKGALVDQAIQWRPQTRLLRLDGKNPGDVFQAKKEPYLGNNPHRMRLEKENYVPLNPERPDDLSHPLGKNPGDVLKLDSVACPSGPQRWEREGTNRVEARFHEQGKNPSDVVGYNSKYFEPHGQTIQGFIRSQSQFKERLNSREEAKLLFPNDPKKQQEYINFVHDHASDPKGPNPRDIIKIGMHHGSSLTTGRASHYVGQEVNSYALGKNPSDFWSINTKPFKGAHFAVYPVEICIKPILSSCPPGDGVVLDPMCGSGSTCVAAKMLGRNFIGIEINSDYVKLARERLAKTPEPLDSYLKG
jgi:DNA modification methylase